MPQVDPKAAFWFGVWTNILILIAGYGVQHAPTYVAQYAPDVQWFAGLFAQINGLVLTALAGISSSKPGPFVNLPAPSPQNVAKVLIAAFVVSLFLASGSAMAQEQRLPRPRPIAAPAPTPETGGSVAPLGDIFPSYQIGKPHLLRLPNPLGLADPLCLTDHPGNNCPQNTAKGGGVNLTGDAGKDLSDFLKRGGITLVRDMKRADQYLSAPANVGCTGTGCGKVDLLGSSCLEAVIPVSEMVVNGPQPPAPVATPSPTPSASPSPSDWPPTVDGPNGTKLSTLTPAISMADEGIITQLAKQDIVLIALQSPALMQGCGGFIQGKVKDATTLAAGILQFITTLGVTVPAVPIP